MQLLEALPKLISWAIPLIILAVIIMPQAIRILREYERAVISVSENCSAPKVRD